MSDLTDDQIDLLAQILIEEYGTELTDDQIVECASILLEDIAGLEVASDDEILQTINRIRSAYYVTANYQ